MVFCKVMDDIDDYCELAQDLYDTQADFYIEDVEYRDIATESVQSNKIKKSLHQILTNAIFNYSPYKDLLAVYKNIKKPTASEWGQEKKKWVSLTSEPIQHISQLKFQLLINFTCLIQF